MRKKTSRKNLVVAILVVAFAASYFLLTFNRTLNSSDEGYLLYNFQKAAEGQVAHRDFYDAYGPGIYWVGGTLFNLFGTRIIVIKVFVVLLKTSMALLVFLIALRILPATFAFLGALLFVLNWGDPLIGPVNVLYAGHVNQFFALLGIFFMLLYIDSGRRSRLFGVSACVGLSMLFKLHVPVVDLVGFSLLLCLKEQSPGESMCRDASTGAHPSPQVLRLLRSLKLLGIFGAAIFFFVFLTGGRYNPASFFLFLLPICMIFLHIIVFESRALRDMREDEAAFHWERLKTLYGELAILVVGPTAAVLFVFGYYSVVGGLPDLLHDVFVLPTYIKYHHSMPDRGMIAAIAAGIVLAAGLASLLGKRIERTGKTVRRLFTLAVPLLLIAPVAAAFFMEIPYRIWHRVATHVLLPAPLIIGVCLFLLRRSQQQRSSDDIRGFWSLGLILVFASQSLLLMSLRADETHIVIYSTAIFAAIAFVLHELYKALRRVQPGGSRAAGAVAVAACLAALSIPYLWSVKIIHVPTFPKGMADIREKESISSYPMLIPDAPRAKGLRLPVWNFFTPPLHHPMSVDMNRTINFIREQTSPDERIFLTCGDQIIYFLSERESALGKENYFAYLANMEFIDRTNTGRVSDGEILEKLAAANPRLIIQTPKYADTVFFGLTFPKTGEFIKNGYEVDTVFGEYQILRRRGSPPSSR